MQNTLETTTSADGTGIALQRSGSGPVVVLIGGAFNDRSSMAGLAASLATHFTAVTYDRRGRGDSGDASAGEEALAREREFQDLNAVIEHTGGKARVFGHSSGAVLALEALAALPGIGIDHLAVYEPPYILEGTRTPPRADLLGRLRKALSEGHPDEAVTLFQIEAIGLPAQMVEGMRKSEMWAWLTRLAPSLPYDVALFDAGYRLPAERLETIRVPTLAIAGGNSPDWARASTRAVADAIPAARYLEIPGQDHGVPPEVLAPVLTDFFGS